jgi:hydrogenase maturation protease
VETTIHSQGDTTVGVQTRPRNVVIGVGNRYRCDDAVGLYVACRIREQAGGTVDVFLADGDSTALMDAWKDAGLVIICDAVCGVAGAGTVYEFDLGSQPVPYSFFRYSSHTFNLAETIELSRILGELPERLLLYGVEGEDFSEGEGISPMVLDAAERVAERILARIEQD